MDTDALSLLPEKEFLQNIVDFILLKYMLRFLGCMQISLTTFIRLVRNNTRKEKDCGYSHCQGLFYSKADRYLRQYMLICMSTQGKSNVIYT